MDEGNPFIKKFERWLRNDNDADKQEEKMEEEIIQMNFGIYLRLR